MRIPVPGALVAAVSCVVSVLCAQEPPPPRADGGPAMFATDRHLFVVRGDVLWQFDVRTLAVLQTFRFPAAGATPVAAPSAPAAAAAERLAVAPPPPLPPPRVPAELAAAVQAGVQWLVVHQDRDGRWDCDAFMKHDDPKRGEVGDGPGSPVHDVGVTGLAALALLADGNTLRAGPRQEPLQRAVAWLRDQQVANGRFGVAASHDFVYDHAIAALAVCEAYGRSQVEALQESAQKGIDYLESHRNPYSVWRYQPRDNDNDTSVTTWALCALAAGQEYGLRVNRNALSLAGVWYDQVTTPDGRAGYSKAGEPSSRHPGDHATRFPPEFGETMTAAALCGRQLLGQTVETKPILKAGADLLASKLPRWEPRHIDGVYWYFGTRAMAGIGGQHWERWLRALGVLLDHQRTGGNVAGSWDPVGVWDEQGGRVFATALCTLSLAVAQRAAPPAK